MTAAALAAVLCALAAIAWVDFRRWEIDPYLTGLAALAALPLAVGDPASRIAGAAFAFAVAAVVRCYRPGAIGLGDLYLYALCGWLTGFADLPLWAAANAALAFALTACLARRRGRAISRCAVPAALAACPAAAAVLIYRAALIL